MNYLDIREEQGTSYFIIRYTLTRKRNYQVSLHMDFNYYFKIVLCCLFFIPQFYSHVRNNLSRHIISHY